MDLMSQVNGFNEWGDRIKTILLLGDKIPQNILTEDEQLLQYYDIAQMRA